MRSVNLIRIILLQKVVLVFFLITQLALIFGKIEAAETYTIGIIRDGDSEFFDAIIEGFKGELQELADSQYDFILLDDFNAQSAPSNIEKLFDRALGNESVDLIFAAGIIASAHAQSMSEEARTKPIIAGAIEFSNFNNEGVSPNGTSSLNNFSFVMGTRRIPADLATLASLTGVRKVYTFVDRSVIETLRDDISGKVEALADDLDIENVILPVGNTAQTCMNALPEEAKAVYVPILPFLPNEERIRLFQLLADRGVASLSMMGSSDVAKGALAGLSTDESKALFRRFAVNIHQILSGVPTSLLPVVLHGKDQLVINMRTARQIGWSPDYDTLLSAEMIGLDAIQSIQGEISLEKAMSMAEELNVDIRVASARLDASFWETRSLKANLFPQIGITGQIGQQGAANRINPLSDPNTGSLSFGAEISQVLYSDRLTSQIRAQKQVQAATELDLESVRLDSVETAGKAFLDCLLSEAQFQIDKENLALTIQNLNLAKLRSEIGAAEASEVFRWEASLAQAKSQLITRDSARRNARLALNVAIAQPRTANWQFTDIQLPDDDYYFMNEVLSPTLKNLRDFDRYTEFIKELSVLQSPELQALDKNLDAQGILLSERGRRNFLPQVSLMTSARQVTAESFGKTDGQQEWTVGIGFTIPIFEGGLRKAESGRINAVIEQLKAQRELAQFMVEQKALSSIYNSAASHPGLRLARVARAAAQKNYDATQIKYSLGTATILNLLDAQTQLVSQRQAEIGAKYQYLKDIVSIQRSIAWFEFSKSPEEKSNWTNRLIDFLQRPNNSFFK